MLPSAIRLLNNNWNSRWLQKVGAKELAERTCYFISNYLLISRDIHMPCTCYSTLVTLNDCPRDLSVYLFFRLKYSARHIFNVFRESELLAHGMRSAPLSRMTVPEISQRGQTCLWVSTKQTPASVKAVNTWKPLEQITTLAQYWKNGCIPDLHSVESFWITKLFSNT